MNTLDDDLKDLKNSIQVIHNAVQMYSGSEFSTKKIPISTFYKFKSNKEDYFYLNTKSLFNIANRLDEMACCETKYEDEMKKVLRYFIKRRIVSPVKQYGNVSNINHTTLTQLKRGNLKRGCDIRMLVKHARIINETTHTHSKRKDV